MDRLRSPERFDLLVGAPESDEEWSYDENQEESGHPAVDVDVEERLKIRGIMHVILQ